ncbi:hypothetical protein AVEN_138218-1 [Araneus ventricosus]|uniref:Uncharacterized protein n=1 Tax=Araneus ventricosus TaxID=182803 RepID=A0A4Y2M7G6_ARAVE|nr:hypothetical protein AVEN_138218-1 [Araneus ventricosus]
MESLKVVYSIKKFAPFVVIEFSKISCIDPDLVSSLDELMKDETSKEIFESINLLLEYYKDITDVIGIKEFEDGYFLSSKREFMKQLVSRCLKLSEGDLTFFEFLLVCVYICRFSECIYAKYRCCKILKVIADCLEAVYCRKYFEYFQEHRGFLGLADFCRNLNNCKPSVKYADADGECITHFPGAVDPERNEKVKNLRYLNHVDNVTSINILENKLLRETMYKDYKCFISSRPDQSEDFLIDMRQVGEMAQDYEMEGCEAVPEKRNKTGIRCNHCRAKCSQYPEDLVNVLKKYEGVRMEVRNF